MQVMVPVRSVNMYKEMVQSGADEIYVGLKPDQFKTLSFDGRFQLISSHEAHCQSLEELGNVIKLSKADGVAINFMANARYVPKEYEQQFIQHIEYAVSLGVDSITIGSIQTARLIKKSGIELPLVAGSLFGITNIAYTSFLRALNINRITLSHFSTLEEIRSFRNEGFEIIIKGNFTSGGMPGFCQMGESPNSADFGDGTRSNYSVTRKKNVISEKLQFIDAAGDCALCSLQELYHAGASTVQLIGREAPNSVTMAMVVDMFKKWIKMYREGNSADSIKKHLSKRDIMWVMKWQPRFCEKKRCSYLTTPNTKAFV